MQLHQDYDKFAERNTIIVTIGPESSNNFKTYWEENNYKFIGIPDAKQSVLKLYEQEVNILKLGRMPAQMLVDKDGVLRYIHYGHSMKDIPENSEILEYIDSLRNTN
ncbi:MAG: alkyl hydroperoxide reductase/Thiol specific antioxidant/Mal allergen [Sedimentibacter sp.]|jgi:peroxiredoxin Q/BCP|nr:alkyl hydroperoxide reductase/Thiol specific antioxidant/Mal allergen [Sedimentibacter sp.]